MNWTVMDLRPLGDPVLSKTMKTATIPCEFWGDAVIARFHVTSGGELGLTLLDMRYAAFPKRQ